MNKKEVDELRQFTERLIEDLDDAIEVAENYKKLYYIACMILDSHLPIDTSTSWYNIIVESERETRRNSRS